MSKIFDPGRGDRKAGKGLAKEGLINQFGIQGSGGVGAQFNFTPADPKTGLGGGSTVSTSLGSFEPLLQGLQGLGQFGLNQAQGGGPTQLLGGIDNRRFQTGEDFGAFGESFAGDIALARQDPFDLGADISSRLRQLSERRNQRGVNKFFDRLKRTGNLTSSAGIQRAGDLEGTLFEQGLKFDLAGLEAGRGIQGDAFARAQGASQAREGIGARSFGEDSNLFAQFLQSQQVGASLGTGGIVGAQNLSTLPLQFLQAAQGATALASGTRFGAADVNLSSAAQAKNPLGEAIRIGAGIGESFAGRPPAPT